MLTLVGDQSRQHTVEENSILTDTFGGLKTLAGINLTGTGANCTRPD